jgi:hypothetical protein
MEEREVYGFLKVFKETLDKKFWDNYNELIKRENEPEKTSKSQLAETYLKGCIY